MRKPKRPAAICKFHQVPLKQRRPTKRKPTPWECPKCRH